MSQHVRTMINVMVNLFLIAINNSRVRLRDTTHNIPYRMPDITEQNVHVEILFKFATAQHDYPPII